MQTLDTHRDSGTVPLSKDLWHCGKGTTPPGRRHHINNLFALESWEVFNKNTQHALVCKLDGFQEKDHLEQAVDPRVLPKGRQILVSLVDVSSLEAKRQQAALWDGLR